MSFIRLILEAVSDSVKMYRLFLFFCCTCVIKASPVEDVERVRHPRIIGGKSIEIEDAPYQVSILMLFEGIPLAHTCGGSIISKNYVLTAGHCVIFGPKAYAVKSGTTSWAMGGKMHTVVDVTIHENFNVTELGRGVNDIALMKVTPEFELDDTKEKIVELADKDDKVEVGDDAYVTGWGYVRENEITTTLKGLDVKIMDLEECSEFYKANGTMTEHNICAKHSSGDKDFCDGDSGGPLMVKGKQVGIVSWSAPGCNIAGRPGVYVDVAKYRDWIDENTKV